MAEQHSLTEDFETPYKFNGKELDTETGYYYYGARYYDPRINIWLSVDPMMEEYPNVNPYAYCLQNPVNLIDPDGRAPKDRIYVDQNGSITKVEKDGSVLITIVDGGIDKRLSDYDISRSLFSWNNRNRQVVANVAAYYGRNKAGVTGVGATYENAGMAHFDPHDNMIYIAPGENGRPNEMFNNYANLVNALVHEYFHKQDHKNGVKTTYLTHAQVYLNQMIDKSFNATSKEFAEGVIGSFAEYLKAAKYYKMEGYDEIINKFNQSNIRGGYKINDRNSGGMQILNPAGNEVIYLPKPVLTDPN